MPRKKPVLFGDDEAPLRGPFGESSFASGCELVASMSLTGTRRERRVRVRERCPQQSGVYGFVNRSGELVYVGMSRNLRHRLLTYFSSASRRGKEIRIAGQSGQLLWQPTVHPIIARLRELELIRRFRPVYNVEGHPWRMREAYIVLVDNAAPWFRLEKESPAKSLGLWGPIPISRRTKAAITELNLHFRLRDCSVGTKMQFSDQVERTTATTSCLRAETQSCLAPCIGCCSRKDYDKALRAARAFLDGRPNKVLEQVYGQMLAASQELRFERASRLRDVAQALERIEGHLRRFHDWMAESTWVLPTGSSKSASAGDTSKEHWLIVVRGAIQQVVAAPTNVEDKSRVLDILQQAASETENSAMPSNFNHFQVARVVRAWFRKHPEQREKCWTLRQAIARCRRRRVA